MQKIAEETKIISVNLRMDQYQWMLQQADKREISSFIRRLIDQEIERAMYNEEREVNCFLCDNSGCEMCNPYRQES